MTDIREETITLPDGSTGHYATAGTGDEVLVLLHGGLPGSSGVAGWRTLMPALAEAGLRVIAPDRPGFGRADQRERYHPRLGIMSWVDHLNQLVTALELDQFHLGGNSQGAQIAAHYAVNHFNRVKSLGFIASAGLSASLGIPESELLPGDYPPRFNGTADSMRAMLEHIVLRQDQLTAELIQQRTDTALRQEAAYAAGSRGIQAAWSEPNSRQWMDIGERLRQLSIPMIYLHGRQDVLNPLENAHQQEDHLPNCQFFYPDNCGHQGQTDQPEIFARVLSEFFTTGTVSTATAYRAGISERRPFLLDLATPLDAAASTH